MKIYDIFCNFLSKITKIYFLLLLAYIFPAVELNSNININAARTIMKSNATNLVKSKLRSLSPAQLGVHWELDQNIFSFNSQKLVSDISDTLGIVWRTKKGLWQTELSGPFSTEKSAKESLIEDFYLQLEKKIDLLNFYLSVTPKVFHIMYQNKHPSFISLERALIENAIHESLRIKLINRTLQSDQSKLRYIFEDDLSLYLWPITLPFKFVDC